MDMILGKSKFQIVSLFLVTDCRFTLELLHRGKSNVCLQHMSFQK